MQRVIELVHASQLSGPSPELHSTVLALADLTASCLDSSVQGGYQQWHHVAHQTTRVQELAKRVNALVARDLPIPTLQVRCTASDDATIGLQCLEAVQRQVDAALALHESRSPVIVYCVNTQ